MYLRRTYSSEGASPGFGRSLSAALVLLVAISLGACTDRPETDEMVADTAAVTGDTTDTMAGMTETDTIEVELVAFEIEMPEQIQAGSRVFEVTNDGEIQHAFEIEGQGSEWVLESINPGETATLTADLQPGTYTVYCPVGDHRAEGMETSLTVEPNESTAATGSEGGMTRPEDMTQQEGGMAQGETDETTGAY